MWSRNSLPGTTLRSVVGETLTARSSGSDLLASQVKEVWHPTGRERCSQDRLQCQSFSFRVWAPKFAKPWTRKLSPCQNATQREASKPLVKHLSTPAERSGDTLWPAHRQGAGGVPVSRLTGLSTRKPHWAGVCNEVFIELLRTSLYPAGRTVEGIPVHTIWIYFAQGPFAIHASTDIKMRPIRSPDALSRRVRKSFRSKSSRRLEVALPQLPGKPPGRNGKVAKWTRYDRGSPDSSRSRLG